MIFVCSMTDKEEEYYYYYFYCYYCCHVDLACFFVFQVLEINNSIQQKKYVKPPSQFAHNLILCQVREVYTQKWM